MMHSQNRGNAKRRQLSKKYCKLNENNRKFINVAEIGEFINFEEIV